MSDYKPGEIVNITIRGARIDEIDGDTLGVALTPGTPFATPIDVPLVNGVTVERAAPAEWPPQQGDLWRDSHGSLWFALGRRVLMVPGDPIGDLGGYEPGKVLAKVGPLTLVHREGASS